MHASHVTAAILQLQRFAAALLYIPAPAGSQTSQIRYILHYRRAQFARRAYYLARQVQRHSRREFSRMFYFLRKEIEWNIEDVKYICGRVQFPVRDDGRLKTLLTPLAQEHHGTPMQYPRH